MKYVDYRVVDRVGVITLDRANKANAQNRQLLDELNESWESAASDSGVRVVLLQANGRHFSAGMELSTEDPSPKAAVPLPFSNTVDIAKTLAWRNVPKPSIAAVQGKCIAAGLLLCWPCDLIIAADDAEFSDPTAKLGMAGVEYMAHVWELGQRKAKEMLLRSSPINAREAMDLGMVNRVVPLQNLREEAMTWAREIAALDPTMAAVIKRTINGTVDIQGFTASITHSFDILEVAYALSTDRNSQTSDLEHMRSTNADIERREATRKESADQ
jgi:enoyl-CoA hydratase/carnithine racemase